MKYFSFVSLFTLTALNAFSQDVLVDTAYRKFNTLVVTNVVNKITERKTRIANEVNAISSEQIKAVNSINTADLLQNTGNLFVNRNYQGGGSPIIRGFEGSRIGLYVDGVRVNNLLFSANQVNNIVNFDQNILENIEILNGPSSTIYGSDALGGVIHLRTKMPELENDTAVGTAFSGNLFAKYNSINKGQTYHADINFGDGRTASLTSISYSMFDDLKMGKSLNPFNKTPLTHDYYVGQVNAKDSMLSNPNNLIQKNSGYNQLNIVEKILFKPEENVSHLFNIQYSQTSAMGNYGQFTEMNYNKLKYAESTIAPQNKFLVAYDFNIVPDSTFFDNLHVGLNLQDIQQGSTNRLANDTTLYSYDDHAQVIGGSLDFIKTIDKNNIRYGFDAQYNSLVSKADPNTTLDSTNHTRQNLNPLGGSLAYNAALYATHTYDINEQLIFTDGLRVGYNGLSAQFGDTASYYHFPTPDKVKQSMPVYSLNAGVVYFPIKSLKLNAIISTGYKAPNVSDLSQVFNSTSGAVIIPNEKLKAENVYNFDLGTTYWYNENIWLENTFFASAISNALSIEKSTYNGKDNANYYYYGSGVSKVPYPSGVYSMQNNSSGIMYGVSTKINVSFAKYWQIVASFNYTHGKFSKPSIVPMSHIPPVFAYFSAKYSKGKYTAVLTANYNGLKALSNYGIRNSDNIIYAQTVGTPAWYILNISTQYNFNDNWHLQAGVDNILDTQYRTFRSGINAPGRNIYVALRFNW